MVDPGRPRRLTGLRSGAACAAPKPPPLRWQWTTAFTLTIRDALFAGIDIVPDARAFHIAGGDDVMRVMEGQRAMGTVVTFVTALIIAGTIVYAAFGIMRLAVRCVRWMVRSVRSGY